MKFLDLNGLNHFWTKIKASFGTVFVLASQCEEYKFSKIIPFVSNHQFINVDIDINCNVYNWFQKASIGGTLDIAFTKIEGCSITCSNNDESYIRKMALSTNTGPYMETIHVLNIQFSNYVRLVKIDDNTLLVAEFVENKYTTTSS